MTFRVLSLACLASLAPMFGQTVISPGANVQTAVNNAAAGSTLALNAGTYSMPGTLVITKPITIRSNTPGQRPILQFPAGTVVGVDIKASNVTLESVRIAGSMWGVYAGSASTAYSNMTVRNVAVAAVGGGNPGHGLFFINVTNAVVDSNIIESAPVTGILIDNNSHNSVVINNNVSASEHGIGITRSDAAIVAGNTLTRAGQFGIILGGSRFSRVERNIITSGVRQDGIVVTRDDATNTLSQSNYVGRNLVSSTGFTTNNPAGTGIWLNSQSNGTLVYGNTTSGAPENGLSIFNTSNAWLWGNNTSRNGHGGIFVHGPTNLPYSVGPAPNNNFVQGNFIHDLTANAGVNLHATTNNTVFNNMVRDAPAGVFLQSTSGNRLFLNILQNTQQGLHALAGTSGSTYFLNRHVSAMPNYRDPGTAVSVDAGPVFGGNFQVGGKVLDDAYPYNNEQLSKPAAVSVTLPMAGAIFAVGTRKTIEWSSSGCTYVDIALQTSAGASVGTIADNYPDTGVYQWDVSTTLAAGAYTVVVQCNNAAGAALPVVDRSDTFTIAPAGVELLSPHGNHRANGGSATTVAWRRTGSATGPITIQYRPFPGAGVTTLATNLTDNEARVTVPAGGSANAMFIVRIDGSAAADSSDGFVNVTDATPVVMAPTGTLPIGTLQLVQWNSHPNSFYVDIEYWDTTANTYRAVATNLPDFGRFYFLVPDKPMVGSHLRVRFKTSALAAITTANSGTFGTAVNTTPDNGGTAAPPNVVRSITPTSGTAASQTFSIVYSDPNGANDIATTQLLLNASSGATACVVEYTRATNAFRVAAGGGFCSLGSGSSAAVSGNTLTVNYVLTFQTSGAGTYTTLAQVADAGGQSSGPQTIGQWTVPSATTPAPSAPQVVSLTPTSGAGSTGLFTAIFRHSGGLSKHYLGYILFLPTPNVVSFQAQGSCLIEYNRISNGMRLINNAGDNWIGPLEGVPVEPSTAPLSNNACTVTVAQSSVALTGADMTVRVHVTFNPAVLTTVLGTFIQEQDVDGKWTDFRQFGNWVLPTAPRRPGPYVVGSSPASGTGSSLTLATTVGHTSGVGSLGEVHLRLSSRLVGAPACHVVYFSTNNTIAVVNTTGNALVGPVPLGAAVNAGHCALAVGAARSDSGTNLTLNLPLTFNAAGFGGAHNLYVNAFDRAGALTHWVQTGTWNVQ